MNACPLPFLSSRARAASVCVCMLMCTIAFRRQLSGCFSSVVASPSLGSFLVLVWVNLDGDVALHIQTIRNL